MNRILIVSYSYSPHLSPRALRWSTIADYWSCNGRKVDVVCSWNPGSPRKEIQGGVRVFRRGSGMLEQARTMLLGRTAFNVDVDRGAKTAARTPSILKRAVKRVHDLTWKKVYWPDYAALWFVDALKCARKLMQDAPYDAMYSVAPPFTGHLVGLAMKRRFPGLLWIADSGDPFAFAEFSTMNNQRLYSRLNMAAEGRVIRAADKWSVTTKETARMYAERFPSATAKIEVIPPLLNSRFKSAMDEAESCRNEEKIRLVYVGNFHRGLREPTAYMQVLEAALAATPGLVDRVEMHFLGDSDLVRECMERHASLRPVCRLHGRCGQAQVVEAIAEADVLVNIGNATEYQLPSKVIEYAYSGKSILNFSTSCRDSSAAFLRDYPLIMNVVGSGGTDDANAIVKFLLAAPKSRIGRTAIDEFIKPYTVDCIAARYSRLGESTSRADSQRPPSAGNRVNAQPGAGDLTP